MEKEKEDKIKKYEDFIENVLKVDLKEITEKLEEKSEELKQWTAVKRATTLLKCHDEKVDVDLNVYTQIFNFSNYQVLGKSQVKCKDKVFVKIGCDCLLEMDLEEAFKYANIRIKMIDRQIEHFRKLAVQVKVNIKLTLLAINEFSPIQSSNIK